MKTSSTKYICIYAASSTQIDAAYFQAATQIGSLLAQHGYGIINGAGRIGLMQAVSDAALKKEGRVTGIIPKFMVEHGWQHDNLTELIVTDTMHERKQLMAEKSQGIIALPGGCGTLEEVLEVITWKQLGLFTKPIVILNTNNYYDPLLSQLKRATEEHFMAPHHSHLWHVANSPEEALKLIMETPEWDTHLSKSKVL